MVLAEAASEEFLKLDVPSARAAQPSEAAWNKRMEKFFASLARSKQAGSPLKKDDCTWAWELLAAHYVCQEGYKDQTVYEEQGKVIESDLIDENASRLYRLLVDRITIWEVPRIMEVKAKIQRENPSASPQEKFAIIKSFPRLSEDEVRSHKPDYISNEQFQILMAEAKTIPSVLGIDREEVTPELQERMRAFRNKLTDLLEDVMPVTARDYKTGAEKWAFRVAFEQESLDAIREAQETLQNVAEAMFITLPKKGKGKG